MTTPIKTQESRTADLIAGLNNLRKAIRDYVADHGCCPGATTKEEFAEQITSKTDVDGRVGIGEEYMYGPYITGSVVPVNPFTQTNDIRVVEEWPDDPMGKEAWIYNRCEGEIRPNVNGITPDGNDFFNL